MLDNGFSLAKVELLNWGNFHGYQKFSLFEPSHGGPLFSPAAASAILGINGSGKSTLIDALMIVLLPFEGSVKLGVTNDVEAGSSGGRTIRDYVLGKHSSHSGVISEPEAVFGRKEGCSFVLLNFVHNRQPDRKLTLGRAWWYHNYKVSDTQVAFLAYNMLSVQDLCTEGKTPPTAKWFRQHAKSALSNVQIFETMQSYFAALSQSLGRITRDDLKILNRTFFVKSISNIDQFIRENMLIDQDSPNLDRLMENVRNGQEIALSIETCEAKITSISRILRELTRLVEFSELELQTDRRKRLLSLYREWREWRDLVTQKEALSSEKSLIELRLPTIKGDAIRAEESWRAAENRLLNGDIEARLGALDQEISSIQTKVAWKSQTLEKWRYKAKTCKLALPTGGKSWIPFIASIEDKISKIRADHLALAAEIEDLRDSRFALDATARERREELEHIVNSKSLIPKELHHLRDAAAVKLNVPRGQLMFVGELLQVKTEARDLRTAIEAVLFPVARNLLCHPESLHALTRWLDQQGLRTDVTVKRISPEELNSFGRETTDQSASEGTRILDVLEMRSSGEHPFSEYLWNWLYDSFDYHLVDIKKFKSQYGRLVTIDGLVKKDHRTMRKLKRGFAHSLGWENADRIEHLTQELVLLQNRRNDDSALLEEKLANQRLWDEQTRLLAEISDRYLEIHGIEDDETLIANLLNERRQILDRNPDHKIMRLEVEELKTKASRLTSGLLKLEAELENKNKQHQQVEGLIPIRERELKSSKLYSDLILDLNTEEALSSALLAVQATLEKRALSRLQLEAELAEEALKCKQGRDRALSTAARYLNEYRHSFNDPNLPYDLGGHFTVNAFLNEWIAAEKRLSETELPKSREKWQQFFDQVLLDSVKDMINEIKARVHDTEETVRSINEVLKLTNFEDLVTEQRYLQIDAQTSSDDRIRKFRKSMSEVEKTLSPAMRIKIESNSQEIMQVLGNFVDEFQKDTTYRAFVTDVRNHFQFAVHSLRRMTDIGPDEIVEVFSGARKDAKSSAQTTQLAYALLASCLAYRFHFHDPIAGADTPRFIVFDEFGGKFDNEKPREILKLLDKMGFQSVLVSPMSKADLLADSISQLVLVHKISASKSRVQSFQLQSREDYERLLNSIPNNIGSPQAAKIDYAQ